MSTTITAHTQAPRGTDRRQRSNTVDVERRTQERRTQSAPKAKESAAPDATNFSAEALQLSGQPQKQSSQLAARGQLQSTLGNLFKTSDAKAAGAGAATGAATSKNTRGTNPAPPSDATRQANYQKRAKEMDSVVGTKNDTLRNLKITEDYSKLSKEMREMLGPDSGANWPTFATWASRQAGETIRQEDLGAAAKFGKTVVDTASQLPIVGMFVAPAKAGSDLYNISSGQVAKGNRKVYKEIAPQFARFIETFKGDKAPDAEKLKKFQEGFKSGGVNAGGQSGLKQAFNNYYKAMFEKDPDKKKELMFLANSQVGGHEQARLQPEIEGAIPYGTRGLATNWMMKLGLPDGRGGVKPVSLGDDVPAFHGQRAPKELQTLENKDAVRMVNGWDRNPNSLKGSGAGDWTKMSDRMNYILDLFRSRQDDPALFQEPFTPSQTKDIMANRIPDLAAS